MMMQKMGASPTWQLNEVIVLIETMSSTTVASVATRAREKIYPIRYSVQGCKLGEGFIFLKTAQHYGPISSNGRGDTL